MATTPRKNAPTSPDRPPVPVDVVAPSYGQGDYKYEVQMLFEIQKSMGEVKASIANLHSSLESTKSKVDDLVRWKYMIVGGAVVVGVIGTIFITIVAKGWDYFSLKTPEATTQAVQQIQQPTPPPAQGKP